MNKKRTTKQWYRNHVSDPFVKKSKTDGYRSRAAYKLIEMHEKQRLFVKGMTVIDLGAAPGGWSQVARQFVGEAGRVIATDRLPMAKVFGVEFIRGDFTEQEVFDNIMKSLDGQKADLVISDMAPNITGVPSIDQPGSVYLVELALDLSMDVLKTGGCMVVKGFHGAGFDAVLKEFRRVFVKVSAKKPAASRSHSKEVYLLARNFKGRK